MRKNLDSAEFGFSSARMVSVNYDKTDAISNAIEVADFDYKYFDESDEIDVEDIPVGGNGKAIHEVFEIHFKRLILSQDLPAELNRLKVAFVDPLTALRYAAKFRKRQKVNPLNTMFRDKKGRIFSLELDSRMSLLRDLYVFCDGPENYYSEGNCFLVVRKSGSGKKPSAKR
jgi:hypothetical protein